MFVCVCVRACVRVCVCVCAYVRVRSPRKLKTPSGFSMSGRSGNVTSGSTLSAIGVVCGLTYMCSQRTSNFLPKSKKKKKKKKQQQ